MLSSLLAQSSLLLDSFFVCFVFLVINIFHRLLTTDKNDIGCNNKVQRFSDKNIIFSYLANKLQINYFRRKKNHWNQNGKTINF